MERAVFGASEFFSHKAFSTVFRGIEFVQLGQLKEGEIDVVEIWFDPWKVSYKELVDLFFDLHDPTSKEGHEFINQSFIFFATINQLTVAKQKKNELKHIAKDKVITEITPVSDIQLKLKDVISTFIH